MYLERECVNTEFHLPSCGSENQLVGAAELIKELVLQA